MLEITYEELNTVKRLKITEDRLRDLQNNIKHTKIRIIGIPEEEEKKKGYEKNFEEITNENVPSMEKDSQSSPRSTKSPIQDKPKEKHAKTHANQTNKD